MLQRSTSFDKRGCLCGANPRENESVDLEVTYGRVSKLLLEVAIDLGLNFIVKIRFSIVDLFYLKDS